jgi:hypothetical protein
MASHQKAAPPRPQGAASAPSSPSQGGPGTRETIVGRRFEGGRVPLGGAAFERCAFVRCELVYDGRPTRLVDNGFEDCRWSFEGAAGDTLDFVAALCRDDPRIKAMFAEALGLEGRERLH